MSNTSKTLANKKDEDKYRQDVGHDDTQIHKYTNTQIHKYTNTQIQIHKYTNTQIHKYTNTQK